jgi:hypothetical protein
MELICFILCLALPQCALAFGSTGGRDFFSPDLASLSLPDTPFRVLNLAGGPLESGYQHFLIVSDQGFHGRDLMIISVSRVTLQQGGAQKKAIYTLT